MMPDRIELENRVRAEEAAAPVGGPAQQSYTVDDVQLTRMGKRPVLKRTFGYMQVLGFSCTILVTWEGILLTFSTAYTEVGPAGTVYSYIVVWLGMLSTYICISELVSMAPTAGGQYHWVSMLAPESLQRFLSYVAGWLTLTGWQATCASGAFNSGVLITGLIGLCNPGYVPHGWHGTLLSWAILAFAVLINTAATSSLAKFEGLILVLHIVGFFAVLIPLTYLAPHVTAHDVFNIWLDGGNWHDRSYAFFIGLVGPVYAFVGSDSAVHMAEEVRNAAVVIPQAILLSLGINGTLGFGMLIALLFCMGTPDFVVNNVLTTSLGFPFIQVFIDATKSIPGSAIMASIVLVLGISSTVGLLASSSRMFWSFARDRGLPLWPLLSRLDRRTSIPVFAVITTTTISVLLSLIGIGSSLAFNDLVSITVTGLYASYLIPITLLLWRRLTNAIRNPLSDYEQADEAINTSGGGQLVWGPFRVPGILGIANNILAIVYLTIVFIFAFWPVAQPVNAASMNYACLVFGAVVLFSLGYFAIYARRIYKGPVIEIVPDYKTDASPATPMQYK